MVFIDIGTVHPGRDVDGGDRGPRPGPWAHQRGELLEVKEPAQEPDGAYPGRARKDPHQDGVATQKPREGSKQKGKVSHGRGCCEGG